MGCKHAIKDLYVRKHYDSFPDGYGGENTWEWHELECKGCKKSVKVQNSNQHDWQVFHEHYIKITSRDLDTKECRKIFKTNKDLYKVLGISLAIQDLVLRTAGKRTDKLRTDIDKKKKLIKKHKEELEQMLADYYGGGDIPYNDRYY